MRHKAKRIYLLIAITLYLAACASSPGTSTAPVSTGTAIVSPEADVYTEARLRMVENTIAARNVIHPKVLQAMRTVSRHRFVPKAYVDQAYADHPLPIGYGQTISQPYIVAWVTELVELKGGEKVLEIGTGYQAAVLAELGNIEVYSIEIVPELAAQAEARMEALGYSNVHVKQGDGYYGWETHAPYDAIIVTAAPDHFPQTLVQQLKDGGRLVIPMGPPGGYQNLWQFTKQGEELSARNLGVVAFVRFTGEGIHQP